MELLRVCLVALCVACVCCHADDVDGYSARHLLKRASARSKASSKSTSTGGSASAKSAAKSTEGSAVAIAEATSEAFTEVENKFKEFFDYVFDNVDRKRPRESKEAYCKNALAVIEKELEAAGKVTATAYTEALAEVEVTGTGEACSSAEASAKSSADGYAKILVEAITEASYRTTEAYAEATVDSVIHVIAAAFSEAYSVACVEGEGDAIALQTSLAEAITRPVATVSVLVASGVNCEDQAGYSKSEVEAESKAKEEDIKTETETTTEIRGKGKSEAGGEATGYTGVIEKCTDKYRFCCSSRFRRAKECTCSLTRRRVRCHAQRKKTRTGQAYWSDEDNDVFCHCDWRSETMTVAS